MCVSFTLGVSEVGATPGRPSAHGAAAIARHACNIFGIPWLAGSNLTLTGSERQHSESRRRGSCAFSYCTVAYVLFPVGIFEAGSSGVSGGGGVRMRDGGGHAGHRTARLVAACGDIGPSHGPGRRTAAGNTARTRGHYGRWQLTGLRRAYGRRERGGSESAARVSRPRA